MSGLRINGVDKKGMDKRLLRAGPLTLLWDGGEIRYIRLGDVEVVRRVYVAVRDRNWRTLPGVISDVRQEVAEGSFAITFRMRHANPEMAFAWDGSVTGYADGSIVFTMNGVAQSDIQTNRTGFCVLHPLVGCVGEECIIEHADGSQTRGIFPRDISPHQPFKEIRAIRHRAAGAEVRVLTEGDVFEMEDQRNWSDGSYKTYCRPLDLPKPYALKAGEHVRQSITISLTGAATAAAAARSPAPQRLDLSRITGGERMPPMGVVAAAGIGSLDLPTQAALRQLGAQHLRVDIRLGASRWRNQLEQDGPALASLGVPLEVALHLPDEPERALRQFAAVWDRARLPVARWIVLPQRGVTTQHQAEAAREILGAISRAPLAGGTDVELVAVNREHPPMPQLDLLSFSLNPQVHAFDDLSLIENLESHTDLVATARKVSGGRPVMISPVTLRRRSNPDATVPETESKDALPPSVDPRQRTLFAAAWTVGALTRLCAADSLTLFETHGPRGLLMGPNDSPWPELFPARPGEVFPVYHVLRSVISYGAQTWLPLTVDHPLELAGIVLKRDNARRLLLANLTAVQQVVSVEAQPGSRMRMLDNDNASGPSGASRDVGFWEKAPPTDLPVHGQIALAAYAIAQVDWSEA